jgi:hypothetical protein
VRCYVRYANHQLVLPALLLIMPLYPWFTHSKKSSFLCRGNRFNCASATLAVERSGYGLEASILVGGLARV